MSEDELETIEDIESYAPSVQSINQIVSLLAGLHFLAGILPIPMLLTFFYINIYQAPVIVTIVTLIDGAMLISSIPLYLILGWAIWSLQPWVWKVSVVSNAIFLVIYIIGGIVLLALLCIVFLFALFASDIRMALAPI